MLSMAMKSVLFDRFFSPTRIEDNGNVALVVSTLLIRRRLVQLAPSQQEGYGSWTHGAYVTIFGLLRYRSFPEVVAWFPF